jgi:hypothetical protein
MEIGLGKVAIIRVWRSLLGKSVWITQHEKRKRRTRHDDIHTIDYVETNSHGCADMHYLPCTFIIQFLGYQMILRSNPGIS